MYCDQEGVVATVARNNKENVFEIVLSGPPWGFTLTGGSEFGSKLYVKKVIIV